VGRAATEPGLALLPFVAFAPAQPSPEHESALRRATSEGVVVVARSPAQLFSETSLFLHRCEADLPSEKRRTLQRVRRHDPILAGRRVLVVDDDPRNLLAVTSIVERHGMSAVRATGGKEALSLLEREPNIDVVLMDVMMPGMDGYETMRRLRRDPKLGDLPVVALTAKAMKGDREKCMEAGATAYVTKPVEPEDLLGTLRGCLARE